MIIINLYFIGILIYYLLLQNMPAIKEKFENLKIKLVTKCPCLKKYLIISNHYRTAQLFKKLQEFVKK